jgi:hypothetical protein
MTNKKFILTIIMIIIIAIMILPIGCTSGEEVINNGNNINNENNINDPDDDMTYIEVDNVVDLINNLRSDTMLVIQEGTYYIDDAYEEYFELDDPNQNINWIDNFDGFGLVAFGLNNLNISADGDVTILSRSSYSYVMSFESSQRIKIDGIVFGHETQSECAGGVLSFKSCQDVSVTNSELYGSGIEGLYIEGVDDFILQDSIIRECTYNFMTVIGSSGLLFENVQFLDNVTYDIFDFIMMEIVSDVLFDGVEIVNNGLAIDYDETPETSLFYVIEGKEIVIQNSLIEGNNIEFFANSEDAVTIGENNIIDEGQFIEGMYE